MKGWSKLEQKEVKQAIKILGTNKVPQNIKSSQARLGSKILGFALALMDDEDFLIKMAKSPKETAQVLETFRKLSNIPLAKPTDATQIEELSKLSDNYGIAYKFESDDDDDDTQTIAEGDFYQLDDDTSQQHQRSEEPTNKKGTFSHDNASAIPLIPAANPAMIPSDQSPEAQSPSDLIEDGETDDNRQAYAKILSRAAAKP